MFRVGIGGIFSGQRVVISIENSRVVGNTAATFAGGIYVQTDSTLRVTNTTVENNTAGDRGGELVGHILCLTDQNISFRNCSPRTSAGILT
jgi:hypothetical protein